MEIKVNTVYEFIFPFYNTSLSIPVPGTSRSEAATTLIEVLKRAIQELDPVANGYEESPIDLMQRVAAGTGFRPAGNIEASPELLELRIATLCDDIVIHKRDLGSVGKNVKAWTDLKYEPENYPAIIKALEEVKSKLTP